MDSHVASERHVMFQRSVDEVRIRLDNMIKKVREELDDRVDEIFIQIRRDYRSVLGGGDVPKDGQLLPKAQRLVRKEVLHVIEGCGKRFNRVAGLAVEEKDEEESKASELAPGDNSKAEEGAEGTGEQEGEVHAMEQATVDANGPTNAEPT